MPRPSSSSGSMSATGSPSQHVFDFPIAPAQSTSSTPVSRSSSTKSRRASSSIASSSSSSRRPISRDGLDAIFGYSSEASSSSLSSYSKQKCKESCRCTKCKIGDFVFDSEEDYNDYLAIVAQLQATQLNVGGDDASLEPLRKRSDSTESSDDGASSIASPASSASLSSDYPSSRLSPAASVYTDASSLTSSPTSSPSLLPSKLENLPTVTCKLGMC